MELAQLPASEAEGRGGIAEKSAQLGWPQAPKTANAQAEPECERRPNLCGQKSKGNNPSKASDHRSVRRVD